MYSEMFLLQYKREMSISAYPQVLSDYVSEYLIVHKHKYSCIWSQKVL